MSLSDRANDTNAAPWVIKEIIKLEAERDALAAHVVELRDALEDMVIINEEDEDNVRLARAALEREPTTRVNREQQALLDQIHQYVDDQGLAELGQSRVASLIEAHKQAEEALKQVAYCNEIGFLPESVQQSVAAYKAQAEGDSQ